MTLTVLSDDQVNSILENLTVDELHEFSHVLSRSLHEFSTNAQVADSGVFQQPRRVTTRHPATQATTMYMPSCGPKGMGCKIVSLTMAAPTADPSVTSISPTGVVNIFEPDGRLLGLVHAASLTAFRTALASACLLGRRSQVKTLTVFGSGNQAYWHLRLALMLRGSTVKHVYIINHRFSSSAAAILKRFSIIPSHVKEREGWSETKFSMLTPSFHEFERLQKEYVRAADVVYCCTPSRNDLFDASILTNHEGRKKGRLIIAVGSLNPEMRELPEGLLHLVTKHNEHHSDKPHRHFHKHADEGGVIVVDTLDGALRDAGEIIAAQVSATHLVELGELVMLHELRRQDSESEAAESGVELDKLDIQDSSSAMSSVYGSQHRPSSPSSSSSSPSRKPSFPLPFLKHSKSSSSDQSDKKKHEDHLVRWLRDGTVVYKSVGLGLMDLVVGMHLVEVAKEKNVGTRISGF